MGVRSAWLRIVYLLVSLFKAGQFGFAADASAVMLKSGAATNANFVDGVAVVQPIGGVMVEAALGGQQFTYQAQ